MKILIVEDEKPIADFLQSSFTRELFTVEVVSDGEEGLLLARKNHYDLIVLDNMLPRKSGKEICKQVRLAGITTPILVLSVRAETDMKVDLLNAGADDYLTKPFSFEELLARAYALLRRPKQIEGDAIRLGTLQIHLRAHTIKDESTGKAITLTRKEFMLLEYLLRNKGTVLTRTMILEHVWGMTTDLFSNTIEAHIASLRRKFGVPNEGLIVTISGRGYMISE